MRCLYCDLDGTLLGRGASLLRDGEGDFTLLGVRALEACHRAGVEVVIYSGRRKAQVFEDARLIGSSAYIYEVGCGLMIDGEEEFLTDDLVPGEHTIHDQITASGAPQLLLERYAGRLEYHAPWHTDREVSHLFRGAVDTYEADEPPRSRGMGSVRLVDNGAIHRRSPTLEVDDLHAYHLIPAGASKARAVARHMQARGWQRRPRHFGQHRRLPDHVSLASHDPVDRQHDRRWRHHRAERLLSRQERALLRMQPC